jgi:YD repeat-containing protein
MAVFKVSPNGGITRYAGTGQTSSPNNNGDGGPAINATMIPRRLALGPDGSLYIAGTNGATGNSNDRIRRIDPNGIISTVVGTGQQCENSIDSSPCGGDGGPALLARIKPNGLTVAADGSIYFSENLLIRRVGTDGIVRRFAGDGTLCGNPGLFPNGPSAPCTDNQFAAQARFNSLNDVKLSADGSLYVADDGWIWRIGLDGVVRKVAGSDDYNGRIFSGEGGPATSAKFRRGFSLAIGADSGFFFYAGDDGSGSLVGEFPAIFRVGGNGILQRIAGDGSLDPNSLVRTPGPPTQVPVYGRITLGQDGSLFWGFRHNVYKVSSSYTGYNNSPIRIASEDGHEVYEFDSNGRHLRTRHSLTGHSNFTFGYDQAGRLTSVTDADNNVTQLQRDAGGQLTVIVDPFGKRTSIALDANGYLAAVTNPAGEVLHVQHDSVGLLRTLTDAKGNPPHQFVYDSVGHLSRDTDPAGGFKALSRVLTDTAIVSTVTTGMGRTTTYGEYRLGTGGTARITTEPNGLVTTTFEGIDGTATASQPDGTTFSTMVAGDVRFGVQAPIAKQFKIMLPSGLTLSGSGARTATVSSLSDPFSLTSQVDSTVINGAVSRTVFSAAARTITRFSPEGRIVVTQLDTADHVVEERSSGKATLKLTYGPRGLLTSMARGGRVFRYDYDSAGRMKAVTDPLGRVEQYAFDTVGRVVKQTLSDLSRILF